MINRGFKTTDYKIITQYEQEPTEVNVIPYDTSVKTLMGNSQDNYEPQYSGDIVDMSNWSLQDIVSEAKNNSQEMQNLRNSFHKQQYADKMYKEFQESLKAPKTDE